MEDNNKSHMIKSYNAYNWYFINDSKTQVFSTKFHKWVDVTDSEYINWVNEGYIPTRCPQRNNQDSVAQIYENISMFPGLTREDLIVKRLDVFAQLKKYDTMISLVSYINDTNPVWKAEALQGIQFRDNTYTTYFNILETNENITWFDLEELLPPLIWNN
jgi:hypothetical protein